PVRSDALERTQDVQHAVALKALLAPKVGRAITEHLLDAKWLPDQFGVARHQHGGGAADVRRGHAGPVEIAPLIIRKRGSDPLAWSDQIGLEPSISSRPAARKKA